ncbi:MAG: DNA repair protein RadA [Spirochaetaceae bacterium]
MARARTVYRCSSCGHEEPKWLGRCPQCGEWNTLVETAAGGPGGRKGPGGRSSSSATGKSRRPGGTAAESVESVGASDLEEPRRPTGIGELDRVLGGGIVLGSSVLLGGEPGIGKSTLMLQAAARMSDRSVLYVSAEESARQLRLRARRLGLEADFDVLCDGDTEAVTRAFDERSPELVIVDSVQALRSPEAGAYPGTVNQIKYGTYEILDWIRSRESAVFLVAHVTKEGAIAGPKAIEHMVDTVLYFEHAEEHLRILRATKNRFGSTDEIGLFAMGHAGLREVTDPASVFLVDRRGTLPAGVVVAPVYEGSRVLLVEIQALTVSAKSGVSRTFSDRIDSRRISRVAAVLEKHLGVSFSDQDIYVNVAGGIRIDEVGVELPLAVALYSARTGTPVPGATTVTGEISLAGEIRPVAQLRRRLRTARDMGYERLVGPRRVREGEPPEEEWERVDTVGAGIGAVFGNGNVAPNR